MKVFACVLALCLIAAVYCQAPAANPAAMGVGNQPLVGGARAGGMGGMGLNNLFTMGALTGGLGNDALSRFAMCNLMMQGQSNLLCMTSLMQ